MESTESRFAHLLQPIRELTKNWDVDVASELNDYLEELDEMCITFDGGKTQLNFAEAALLIQGSTCIYSKKVELLHSLVYQTLEYINDRNKRRNKEAAGAQGGNADGAASGHDADDMDVFSPLHLEASENSQKSDSNTTVSVAPLPPESLIPPETHEKRKLPLVSLKGEVVCSLIDFRINLFIPGEDDLILLSLRSAAASSFQHQAVEVQHQAVEVQHPLVEVQHPLVEVQHPLVEVQHQAVEVQHPLVEVQHQAVEVQHPLVEVQHPLVEVQHPLVEVQHQQSDAAENFLPLDDDHMDLDQEPEEHVERHQVLAQSDGRMIRERRQVEADKRRREDEAPPAVNVWALHDPYVPAGEEKPFKSGKCYKVPDGVDDGGKRKRKRAASLQDFRSWFRGTFDPPEHKLKSGPAFTDLNYIYLRCIKDKVRTQRRLHRRAGVVMSEEELRRTFLQPEEAGPQHQEEGLRHADLLGGDDDSDNDHEAFPDDGPAEFGGPDFVSPEAPRDELTYEDLVKLRVDQLVVNSRGYTQETALSRRVKDWEEKIRPELQQQEERAVFDIHDYGERIVTALGGVGRRRAFSSVVHGLDNFEACKFLLASLQLANDHTVEVDSGAGLEDSLDTMSLTLLSTHRATDRFKTMPAST
ncbi:condensin-2 complex subunit H2 [Leuresthes tenuis]|uniref:condensin-2 complex subunit H2 n=1 Tax=Leuresthes tenuis TaxID=355514 RepID=UPI003B514CD8